jgi:hypothetical protein
VAVLYPVGTVLHSAQVLFLVGFVLLSTVLLFACVFSLVRFVPTPTQS